MRQLWLLVPFAVLAFSAPAATQTNDPAWLDKVRDQAAEKLGCDITLFLLAREGELAGRRTYEVRVQCADGRRFDAARTEPEPEFTFSACDTQVC